jgi:lipopolysaccharide transport system ATP-binding protein
MTLIRLEGVGVQFAFDRQQRPMTPIAAKFRRRTTTSWALDNLDLEFEGGESIALIGPTGVLPADSGSVTIDGAVGSLLSIQAGVTALLTGRENAMLLGVLTGLSRAESRYALEDVRERSGLGEAFEHPVSSYSQGMRARLGFAVVDRLEPQILLLDEVHEALDHEFRLGMEERALEIVDRGGIVVAAGHDHAELSRLCDHALLLEDGHVAAQGPLAELGTFERA